MAGRRNGPPRGERLIEDRPPRPRQPRQDLDQEVVVLREQGQSYSAVARSLGIKRATDAQHAFLRGNAQIAGRGAKSALPAGVGSARPA